MAISNLAASKEEWAARATEVWEAVYIERWSQAPSVTARAVVMKRNLLLWRFMDEAALRDGLEIPGQLPF